MRAPKLQALPVRKPSASASGKKKKLIRSEQARKDNESPMHEAYYAVRPPVCLLARPSPPFISVRGISSSLSAWISNLFMHKSLQVGLKDCDLYTHTQHQLSSSNVARRSQPVFQTLPRNSLLHTHTLWFRQIRRTSRCQRPTHQPTHLLCAYFYELKITSDTN